MAKSINFKENNNVVRNENIERMRVEIYGYKTLSVSETMNLITKAQNGSQRAKDEVVRANLRLVWSIAASYGTMMDFEDMFQNGSIGLCKAVETFDVSRGTMFSTWALEQVRKYINIGLDNESRTVRMGAHFIKAQRADIANSEEVKYHYATSSVDAPIGNEDGEEKTLLDFMASDMSADNFSEVEDMRVKINSLMKGLKGIEKSVVCGLFGFGCAEETEYTLSKKFDLTEERIRQIKWEALKKMQELA